MDTNDNAFRRFGRYYVRRRHHNLNVTSAHGIITDRTTTNLQINDHHIIRGSRSQQPRYRRASFHYFTFEVSHINNPLIDVPVQMQPTPKQKPSTPFIHSKITNYNDGLVIYSLVR